MSTVEEKLRDAQEGALAARRAQRAIELLEEGRELQRKEGEDAAKRAAKLYEQALEQDPFCSEALWELGWSYQVLERWGDAVQAWDRLRARSPNYPEIDTHYPVLVMRRDAARALAALPEPGTLPPPELAPRDGPTLRITAVGDIQMGRAWPEEYAALPPDDGKALFEHVADKLSDADITFGNLETVLADSGASTKCRKGSKVCYAFRAPSHYSVTLAETGFDVVSIANNHTGDFGEEGRQATIEALDAAGVRHSGPVGDIASWEVDKVGLKVGLVAFSTGAGLYRVQDIETALKVVAEIDRTHDLVFVSFHGGAEGAKATHLTKETEVFYGENRGNVHAFAHAMVDAGADLVLGHGPHVLRAMEVYQGRLIAYSLGNFTAWTGFNLRGPLGLSAILTAELATNGVVIKSRLHPVFLEAPGVPKPDPNARAIAIVRRLSQDDLGNALIDGKGQYVRPTTKNKSQQPPPGKDPAARAANKTPAP